MKYLDWAAMGVAVSAHAEASRAKTGVDNLSDEIVRLREDINSQKYELEFQKWVDELIYQFDKTVTAISNSPSNPINDCVDLALFLNLIQKNNLGTSLVSGHENKQKFEQTLIKARNIYKELEIIPEVQDHFKKLQEEEQRTKEEERLREAERLRREAEESAKFAVLNEKRNKEWGLGLLVLILFTIASAYINEDLYGFVFLGLLVYVFIWRKYGPILLGK